jgi:hypothetical protein
MNSVKLSPFEFWYPGHNSLYYNRVTRGALEGPTEGSPSRITAGALRAWCQPTMTPAAVIHIKKQEKL